MGLVGVILDSREPEWVRTLSFGGAPTSTTLLDTGDLLAACDDGEILAVERKEVNDFLHSLQSDRLFPQLTRLRQVSPWPYLVLCGSLTPGPGGKTFASGHETGWNWSSIQGALLTVQEIGVPIVFVASDQDYEATVIRLASRSRTTARFKPPREATLVSEAEAILASLPGVGDSKAQALLAYCGNVAWALSYLTDDHWDGPTTVPGIGNGVKRRVRRALELEDWAILSVVTRDGSAAFVPAVGAACMQNDEQKMTEEGIIP